MNAINLLMFLSPLLVGCTDLFDGFDLDRDSELDVRAVYAKEHPWIGKCARFELPMVYITNLPPGLEHAESMRIGRVMSRADEANYLLKTPIGETLVVTPIPSGTTFTVTAVFTSMHSGLSRMFVDDVEVAVLRDNHAQVATTILGELKPCK